MIEFHTKAAEDELELIIRRVQAANRRIVTDSAHLVEANAGRRLHSGYGVVTGTMRRSARVEGPTVETANRVWASVGPTVIYARRFELGFVGPDSLGRVFRDPPRPYWRPAYQESEPAINRIAYSRWGAAVKGA